MITNKNWLIYNHILNLFLVFFVAWWWCDRKCVVSIIIVACGAVRRGHWTTSSRTTQTHSATNVGATIDRISARLQCVECSRTRNTVIVKKNCFVYFFYFPAFSNLLIFRLSCCTIIKWCKTVLFYFVHFRILWFF